MEGDWKGGDTWYRFVEPAGTQLADSIVPHSHCGTLATGKSLSEALIFASTNPQYEDIFFTELQHQYVKIPSLEHGDNMLCTEIDFEIQNNLCTQHVLLMFCKNKSF